MPKHYLVRTRETQIKELVNIICDECKKEILIGATYFLVFECYDGREGDVEMKHFCCEKCLMKALDDFNEQQGFRRYQYFEIKKMVLV